MALRPPRLRTALAALALVLALGGCAALDHWQRRAIFQPAAGEQRWWRDAPPRTESFDLHVAGGETVHAWYIPSERARAPTVLYLHGARWNLNGSVFRIDRWIDMGFNVLAIDYRGFGRSSARLPSEDSAREDALAAFDELRRREPQPARRFVYGHSLGGALAIDLAAAREGIAGLIVESSFTSIRDLVRETRLGWVPFIGLAITQEFDSLAKMARVDEPVLFIHGTADRVVPHTMSDRLYEAAAHVRGGLRRVVKIDGASHSGASRSGGETYVEAVRSFVAQAGAAMPAPVAALDRQPLAKR